MEGNSWISVEDRLPEHDQVVLAVSKLPDTSVFDWYKYPLNLKLLNFYNKNQYHRYFRDKESLFPVNSENITHWMPVPSPPKETIQP